MNTTPIYPQKTEIEAQIKASREAAVSLPKLESYIQLIRSKLATLDFDMRRLALDMLNIKVWMDGLSVEINGTIPIKDADVVTTSSWLHGHNTQLIPFNLGVKTDKPAC